MVVCIVLMGSSSGASPRYLCLLGPGNILQYNLTELPLPATSSLRPEAEIQIHLDFIQTHNRDSARHYHGAAVC